MSPKQNKKRRRKANARRKAAKKKRQKKWNRPRRPSSETPQVVTRYLADVGIKKTLPEQVFGDSILARFGEPGRRFIEAWCGDRTDIVDALAGNLELALAVESQFSGARIELYLSWLVKSGLLPRKRIIDPGCGIGINTCFYAKHLPNADVVGIDCCEAAVACAKQLAAKLGADNVQFECADATALPEHLADQQFDLVTSTFVAHEVGDIGGKPLRTVEEVLSDPGCPKLRAYAGTLSSLLADPTSTLITFERINHPFILTRWAKVLRNVGVGLDLSSAEILRFVEYHGKSPVKVPLLLGSKDRDGTIDADEIRESWRERIVGDTICLHLEGEMVEAMFAALPDADFVKGIRFAASGGSGEVRHEVWQYGPLAFAYQYSRDDHQLIITHRHQVADLIEQMGPHNNPEMATWDIDYCEEYDSAETADRDHPVVGQS